MKSDCVRLNGNNYTVYSLQLIIDGIVLPIINIQFSVIQSSSKILKIIYLIVLKITFYLLILQVVLCC